MMSLMKRILHTLKTYLETDATSSEKSVLHFLLQQPRTAIGMDIRTLARQTSSSASTIIRICQKNGLKGYRELKEAIQNDLYSLHDSPNALRTEPDKDENTLIFQVFREEIEGLENTYHLNDPQDLAKALELLGSCRLIYLFGIGSSQLVARDFQMKLERISRLSILYTDYHMMRMAASNATSQDLAVFFSYSGQTEELQPMILECRKNQTPILAITRYAVSFLSSNCTVCLYVAPIEKPLRPGACSSRIAMLSIVDLLYTFMLARSTPDRLDHIVATKEMMEKEGYH